MARFADAARWLLGAASLLAVLVVSTTGVESRPTSGGIPTASPARVDALARTGPAGGTCAPLDVAFVLDTTTSMNPAISNVKSQLIEFLDEIEDASGGDYRLGLVDFGIHVTVHTTFAPGNRDAVAAAIPGLLQDRRNRNDPEAWDQALATVVYNRSASDVPEEHRNLHEGDFDVPWRPEASKLVVLVTDARPAGWNDEFGEVDLQRSRDAARDALASDIRVTTIFVPNSNAETGAADQLHSIARLGGGAYLETAPDGANLTEGLELAVRTCGADSDGDGLFDTWETDGIDHTGDGQIDLDLPAMGASPGRKDLFVQVNWMTPQIKEVCISYSVCVDLGPIPKAEVFEILCEVFDAAPVSNPDGTTGISLHIDAGPLTPPSPCGVPEGYHRQGGPLPSTEWRSVLFPDADTWGPLPDMHDRWVAPERRSAFTWVLYVPEIIDDPRFNDLLGFAVGIPSDAVLIAGNHMTETPQEAAVVLHELGHTLGLGHGGPDHDNYKPNYLSSMHYGQLRDGNLSTADNPHKIDFSRWQLAPLNEEDLSEPDGLTVVSGPPLTSLQTFRFCDATSPDGLKSAGYERVSADGPIDWNCDGSSSDTALSHPILPVREDRNDADPSLERSDRRIIETWNDWENLSFTGGLRGGLMSEPDYIESEEGFDRDWWYEGDRPWSLSVEGGGSIVTTPGAQRVYLASTLTNMGSEPDRYELSAEGEGLSATDVLLEEVELAPGESAPIAVLVDVGEDAAPDDDTFRFARLIVASTGDPMVTGSVTYTVEVDPTIDDELLPTGELEIAPAQVRPGEIVEVIGQGFVPSGTAVVRFEPEIVGELEVAADEQGEVQFEVVVPEDGELSTVEVLVAGMGGDGQGVLLDGEFDVVEDAPVPSRAASEPESASPVWLFFVAAAVALLAAVAIAVVALRRRRRGRPGGGSTPMPPPEPPVPPPAPSAPEAERMTISFPSGSRPLGGSASDRVVVTLDDDR